MTFTTNIYLWRYDVPKVVSDVDGKSLNPIRWAQVLTMIGRDWTHIGVAKLYTDIVNNVYNIIYVTSHGMGLADSTNACLNGVLQESYLLPKGPMILSLDLTIPALRREIYLRDQKSSRWLVYAIS